MPVQVRGRGPTRDRRIKKATRRSDKGSVPLVTVDFLHNCWLLGFSQRDTESPNPNTNPNAQH